MSKDGNGPSGNKKEEQGNLLTKVVYHAPLFAVILKLLELVLKLLGVIR